MAFIVFEGLDGAGKSTLMNLVESQLKASGVPLIKTRDPGTTELGEKLRNIILSPEGEAPVPKAELLLYQAARVQMVDKVIRPALSQGHWILADRFYSSTLAFQSVARGLDLGLIHTLNDFVAENCHPDLFVFIDIPVSESRQRMRGRLQKTGEVEDRMERENDDFQSRVRAGYHRQAQAQPEAWLVLEGSLTPAELSEQVLAELRRRRWLA